MAGTTIRVPEDLLAEVQKAATAQQRSAEEVIQEALERYLRQKRREKLYDYGESQARRFDIREEDVPELVRQTRRENRELGR